MNPHTLLVATGMPQVVFSFQEGIGEAANPTEARHGNTRAGAAQRWQICSGAPR
jgi:hypothetical protein